MPKKYPTSIRALLQTDLISRPTKNVLNDRFQQLDEKYEPAFFDSYFFNILQAISNRLIPQFENENYIDLASSIDRRLAEGKNDGWRYASMPPDGESYQVGLAAIDEIAKTNSGKSFVELGSSEQDNLLSSLQKGNVSGIAWKQISACRFFEELLAELTEAYYSHPLAQEEIGFAGMADVHGWKAITLNHLEAHEPREIVEQ